MKRTMLVWAACLSMGGGCDDGGGDAGGGGSPDAARDLDAADRGVPPADGGRDARTPDGGADAGGPPDAAVAVRVRAGSQLTVPGRPVALCARIYGADDGARVTWATLEGAGVVEPAEGTEVSVTLTDG